MAGGGRLAAGAALAMDRDEALREGLRRSNARFKASMNRILEHVSYGSGVAAGSGRCPAAGGEAGT